MAPKRKKVKKTVKVEGRFGEEYEVEAASTTVYLRAASSHFRIPGYLTPVDARKLAKALMDAADLVDSYK